MKKFVLFFFLITYSAIAYNQVIKGIILDEKTKSAIEFATIYFNGTFVGTSSDKDGKFELDISKNTSMPLTISSIGYYSVTLADFSTQNPVVVYLTSKEYEVNEVVVKGISLKSKRKAYLKSFKSEFLGKTSNARKCVIMNENDITFNYGSDKDTVKAFASKPIRIDNRALGYKITYYLDKYEYYKRSKTLFFSGNIIFDEDAAIEGNKKLYEERRKNTYFGSRMHFIKALWSDNLMSSGFLVKSSGDTLNYKNIVVQDENNIKFLKYSDGLDIMYHTWFSHIAFISERVFFDKDGYFDPSGITWEGKMAEQRVGDWLPLEYSGNNNREGQETPGTKPTLIEDFVGRYSDSHGVWPLGKSYLHTDRTGYLPGDTVWFKAYCWYGQEGEADTLSGVIHTELTGSDGRALEKKSYRLKEGQGHGEFILPKTLESGDYYLRGWTRLSGDGTMVDPFYRRFTVRGADQGFYIGYDPVLVRGGGGSDSLEVRFRFYDLDPSGSLSTYSMHELNYELKSGSSHLKSGRIALSNTKEGVFRCSLSGLGDKDSTGVLEFMVKDERITYNRQFTIPLKDRLDLRFFPEGGDLVTGLGSRVAFKATGVDGHGKEVEGTVEDNGGNIITSFKGNHLGMGSFKLTPGAGIRYFASVAYQGSRYRFALPVAKEEGSVMRINPLITDSLLHIRILSRYAGGAHRYVLLGCSKGEVRYAALVNPANGLAVAGVPSGLFPEGLAVFTLLRDDFTPECERVVYIDHGQRIRLNVTADSLTYGLRSKVSLTVQSTDLTGEPVRSGLSLSVTDRGQSGDKGLLQDIRAGKYLEQEVRGYIEDAGFYFAGDSCNQGALDLLLLTQGYRKFTAKPVHNTNTGTNTKRDLPVPERSFKVSGRLETRRKRLNGKEMDYRDIGLTLVRFGDEPYIKQYRPDSLGHFDMVIPLGGGPIKVLLQATKAKGKPFPGSIEVEEVESPQLAAPPALPPSIPPLVVEQVQQVQAARKVGLSEIAAGVFRHIDLGEISVTARRKVKDWSHDFKGEADKIADLDSLDPKGDRYRDLYDLLVKEFKATEYLGAHGLMIAMFPIICPRCNRNYNIPIYVINGMVYCNGGEAGLEDLLGFVSIMKVTDIKKIMLIPPSSSLVASYADHAILQDMRQTIVYIETYSNNFYRGDPGGIKTFVMEGLASPREFYSPRYEGALKDSPLYNGRATLYWVPELVTDSLGRAKVEFYTGDRPATLDIRVSGMDITSGAPGEGHSTTKVKPEKQ